MQLSLEWLNEFVDLSNITPEQIAHALTMSGLEVEEVEHKKPKFTNIITAKIVDLNPHPDADKLRLATVNTGEKTKTVVCGAQNIEVGQIIPYASVGSKVFSRKTGELFELTSAKIRGIESQGMLCSADELGLDDLKKEEGILILNDIIKDVKLGQKLEEALGIEEEVIFHTAPNANRGDEMSVIGIARELSALFNKKLNFSPLQCEKDLSCTDFEVEIKSPEACGYYSIGLLKDIEIKPSPKWMQRRLNASGMRPINNVVDITNYVLLEYGTPLHAFDLDKLNGYLCVRYANEGEKLITLDEVERNLTKESVLIASKEAPVCAAGVFGGFKSEIDNNTKNIALEAAYFTPHTNRKSARSIGYRSEASARFERGVDIEAVKPALLRAMQLLNVFANAKIEGIVEAGENKLPAIEITLKYAQVKRILGCEIPSQKCMEILENLGYEILGSNEMALKVKVPSFRINDVTREVDLIEEVARIYGYDKIEPTLPADTIVGEISAETKILKDINNVFLSYGFDEIITSSLLGEPILKQFSLKYDSEKALKVKNPQSEDHTMLRQSLIPTLLNSVKTNYDNGNKNFRLYEAGKVYKICAGANEKNSGVNETRMLSAAVTGDVNNEMWIKKPQTSFYTLKGVLQSLFEQLEIQNRIKFVPCEEIDYMHPKQCAKIELLGRNSAPVGYIGTLHPILKEKLKFTKDLFIFELNLEEILNAVSRHIVKYKKLPQFPQVQRDIAFVTDEDISYEELIKAIKKNASKNLYKGADLFDVYRSENIENGKKSVAFRIYLQDENATLTDALIDAEINKIKKGLEQTIKNVSFRQ